MIQPDCWRRRSICCRAISSGVILAGDRQVQVRRNRLVSLETRAVECTIASKIRWRITESILEILGRNIARKVMPNGQSKPMQSASITVLSIFLLIGCGFRKLAVHGVECQAMAAEY